MTRATTITPSDCAVRSRSASPVVAVASPAFRRVAVLVGTVAVPSAMGAERGISTTTDTEITLYQYEICPFCCKVKAFLDFNNIPYRVVEVNPLYKNEIKFSPYKKVPILMLGGEQINGSSEIISALSNIILAKTPSTAPSAGTSGKGGVPGPVADTAEEEKWRKWVDEKLVHMLSPNIYRTPSEAWQAFEYMTENGSFSKWERESARYFGAAFMYAISFRLRKKHGIKEPREALFAAADEWVSALGNRQFLGGTAPNLADLAVFGVLRAIRTLDSWQDLMQYSTIGPWYRRMDAAVGASSRLAPPPTPAS